MPKISTHLNLGLNLLEKIDIADRQAFMLGNAYPDCWKSDMDKALQLHYKSTPRADCDLKAFLKENPLTDFNLGRYFHLWVDNRIKSIDLGDISATDCVIFDMPVISEFTETLRGKDLAGAEKTAADNIFATAADPVPLYLPQEEKREKYIQILDSLVRRFERVYLPTIK